jgi:hypothetical protein
MDKEYFDLLMESCDQAAAFEKGDKNKCKVHKVEITNNDERTTAKQNFNQLAVSNVYL